VCEFTFFSDYLFSLGKLTSEHVSKTAMQLKSVLEDKVEMLCTYGDFLLTELCQFRARIVCDH